MPKLSSIFDPNVANLNSYFKRVGAPDLTSEATSSYPGLIALVSSGGAMDHLVLLVSDVTVPEPYYQVTN
jgi:hypothetical protein